MSATEKEILLIKSEGAMEISKWLKKKVKQLQAEYEENKKNNSYRYDEYWEPSDKAEIKTLVNIAVSVEKYGKKLKHSAEETKEQIQ